MGVWCCLETMTGNTGVLYNPTSAICRACHVFQGEIKNTLSLPTEAQLKDLVFLIICTVKNLRKPKGESLQKPLVGSVSFQPNWALGRLFPFFYDRKAQWWLTSFVSLWKIQEQSLCQDSVDTMAAGQSWNRGCSVNPQQHGEGRQQEPDLSKIQLHSKPTTIPQQILWLPSICDFTCNFCISPSPSKQYISCNCCPYSKAS